MEERTQSSDFNLSIDRISESDLGALSVFSCGAELIDKFINKEIWLCYKYRYLTSYKCTNADTGEIIGVFTLSNDIVGLPEEEKDFICEAIPEYAEIFMEQSSYPAINIGHLAVNKDLQSNGIGRSIMEFVKMTFYGSRQTGCQFLTVDALNIDNHRTVGFYEKLGFELLSERDIGRPTRRMYLPLFEPDESISDSDSH